MTGRVAFHTLGCRVNQYETEAMKHLFREAGYEVVGEEDPADVVVINTCTVTGLADRKSRQFLRRMRRANPEAVLCATGCYVQVDPEALRAIPEIDVLLGTDEKYRVVEAAETVREQKDVGVAPCAAPYRETGPLVLREERHQLTEFVEAGARAIPEGKTRANIKIEDGCDRYCSYCIIPAARGPVRSRDRDSILAEAENLVGRGYRELVLTGINTALYEDLRGLLFDLDAMDGDFRVRLSSLEPTVVDAPFVERLLQSRRLCHHLHLSIQSGSDHILAAMHRRYGRKEYLEIVRVLREVDPLFNITTDMIVGFPGETDEDHAETVLLAEEIGFGRIHVFPYSRRKGTKAADMPGQVPAAVKKKRAAELLALSDRLAVRLGEQMVGTEQRVLWEEDKDGLLSGYTDNYVEAVAEGPEAARLNTFAVGTVAAAESNGKILLVDNN